MHFPHRALSAGLSSLALHDAEMDTGSPMPVSDGIQINLEKLLTLLDSGDMRAVDMIDTMNHRDGIVSDAGLELLARRLRLPPAAALVAGGMGLAFVPGVPVVELDPDLVLVLFLPPLLMDGAYLTVLSDFRRHIGGILSLAVGAVAG